jgi:2-polyprenyl-3-methyl-5-hydroxy-6-metoxy-1,4-benzoquinol methylase
MLELSRTQWPQDTFDVENQVTAPEHPWHRELAQNLFIRPIQRAGVDMERASILEVGAGLGALSYGILTSSRPSRYVATDTFRQFIPPLEDGLSRWRTSTSVSAGLLDPQDELLYADGEFDAVVMNSVLHHLLDYRGALRRLFNKLPSPGILVMVEPCLDGYLFFDFVSRFVRSKLPLSPELTHNLVGMSAYTADMAGQHGDHADLLAKYGAGDKYMFSIYDMINLARDIGASFSVEKDSRNLLDQLKFGFKIRGATDDELGQIGALLQDLLPVGVESAMFGDLRQAFCFTKHA